MNEIKYKTFKDFYPYYLSEHEKSITKIFHATGSLMALFFLVLIINTKTFNLLPMVLIVGYGFAWVSHLIFEKNKPATFKYPLYSFIGDWVMLKDILTGNIKL